MIVETHRIHVSTKGDTDIIDLTPRMAKLVQESEAEEGQILVFAPGATAGISVVEYEPGLLHDIPEMLEKIAPSNVSYHHDQTWHDGNGHSHLRATLIGPSLTVPFENSNMILGTWQQVILLDFDNRPRERKIVAQIMGV